MVPRLQAHRVPVAGLARPEELGGAGAAHEGARRAEDERASVGQGADQLLGPLPRPSRNARVLDRASRAASRRQSRSVPACRCEVAEPDANSYDIAPDGLEIAFASDTDRSGIEPNFDIYRRAGRRSAAPRDITTRQPGRRRLAAATAPTAGCSRSRSSAIGFLRRPHAPDAVRPARRQDPRPHRGTGIARPTACVVARLAHALFGSIDDAGTRRMYRFDVDGGAPRAVTREHELQLARDRRQRHGMVGMRQSFTEPPTLVQHQRRAAALRPSSPTSTTQRSPDLDAGSVESVTYKGANGDDIQMWVVYPPGFDARQEMAAVHAAARRPAQRHHRWHAVALERAGVRELGLRHRPGTTSTARAASARLADSINPDWISLPYEDTIKAADWFTAQPWIDADRMAAGGGSYGGYLAATILGRPHPFKTLVAHAAVYNSFTQYASDGGAEKKRFFEYWEKPERVQAQFAAHAAANFNTPTLVIHGQLDRRVPVNHGIELFNTLQNRGVPSKLVYFPDENHWVLKPQNSLFWYETKRQWLAQYVKPGPADSSPAPSTQTSQ